MENLSENVEHSNLESFSQLSAFKSSINIFSKQKPESEFNLSEHPSRCVINLENGCFRETQRQLQIQSKLNGLTTFPFKFLKGLDAERISKDPFLNLVDWDQSKACLIAIDNLAYVLDPLQRGNLKRVRVCQPGQMITALKWKDSTTC